MKTLKNLFQKLNILLCVTACSSMLFSQPSVAAVPPGGGGTGTTNYLLTLILGTTAGMLKLLNQTPAYAQDLAEMAKSWIETDDKSNTIGNNQYLFASLGEINTKDEKTQISLTAALTEQFLKMGSFKSDQPVLPSNANDLTYTILFGVPLVKPTSNQIFTQQGQDYSQSIQNYIKNVTGSTLQLDQPNPNWPNSKSKTQYINLYNTLAAVQSYDQYLIGGIANLKKRQDLSSQLVSQATNPDWFKQISTEALGLVIRHILLYTSQTFVQASQIIDLQQKQLAVQAMTNSLLVILVQSNVGMSLQQSANTGGTEKATTVPNGQI